MQLRSSLLLTVHKMQKKRDALKEVLLNEKEPELEDLENSQPTYNAKSEKACSKERPKSIAEEPFDRDHGLNQPSPQRPGVEMGLYQQRHCQFELKGNEKAR